MARCPSEALVASNNRTMRNLCEIRLKSMLYFQMVPSTNAVTIAERSYHETYRLPPCYDDYRWGSVWPGMTWKSNVPWTREIWRRPGGRRSRWRSTGRVSTSSWRSTTCWTWQWFVPLWHSGWTVALQGVLSNSWTCHDWNLPLVGFSCSHRSEGSCPRSRNLPPSGRLQATVQSLPSTLYPQKQQ